LVKLGFERQITDAGQNKKNSILGVFGHWYYFTVQNVKIIDNQKKT
jgi:hypothetical protein